MADTYSDWLTVGMALHHVTQGSGQDLALWERWSRRSPKFDAEVLRRKWVSFHEGIEGGITEATLFYLAKQASERNHSGLVCW